LAIFRYRANGRTRGKDNGMGLIFAAWPLWLISVPFFFVMMFGRPRNAWISAAIVVVAALGLGAYPFLAKPRTNEWLWVFVVIWAAAALLLAVVIMAIRSAWRDRGTLPRAPAPLRLPINDGWS
jgi:hypothetical protein